jgi:hypothetical protein
MIKFIIPFVMLSGLAISQQNIQENYIPLKSSGQLPDVFTQNIRNVIKQDISELNKQKEDNKSLKRTYLTEANYEIEKIVKSGNALVNDEVTNYLNKITDVILLNNPTLRNELHIYTLKSPVVNAYSYDKGYIFIDIGLIAQVETEAQLAYILCHEISHYTKKHHVNGYVQNKKIDRNNYDRNSEDKLIEKCQYSKETESEADVEGFKLFEQTNYNFKQAEKAFDVLQYAHLPFELVEFKKSFFETDKFKLPNSYFLKEVSSIKNNSNEDDTKLTHPNTAKRKQAIAELIANRNNSGKVNSIVGQSQFEYIRDLTRMELCRLYLKRRDYPNALYASYILLNKYPNNLYVIETVSKCMYALSLYGNGKLSYNSDSYLENGFPSYTDVESYPQQLSHLIQKMPSNEWTIMTLNYVYRAHKRFPSSQLLTTYSDSLFKLMAQTNWGIKDFVRLDKKQQEIVTSTKDTAVGNETSSKTDLIANIQRENNFKNYDTAYYKEIYTDLFITDKEFAAKFPAAGTDAFVSGSSGFSSYSTSGGSNYKKAETVKKKKQNKNKNGEYITYENKIQKVLLLEPFYLKIDESKEDEFQYLSSDKKQENYIITVNQCAKKQNFDLVTLDPGLISSGDADKLNDYSTINDWFSEKFDSNNKEKTPIFNTDEINTLIAKYGTQYVFKTGVVNYKSSRGRKRTYYYAFVYDIKINEMVYKKFETFRDKDAKDLVNAKIYQSLYELKHAK